MYIINYTIVLYVLVSMVEILEIVDLATVKAVDSLANLKICIFFMLNVSIMICRSTNKMHD